MSTNKMDKWIEQYFDNSVNFEKVSTCQIGNHGAYVDQMMLRINLPELPRATYYKPGCIYNLINCIWLEINNDLIFKFDSDQLYFFDQVERNIDAVVKICQLDYGKIFYPIDLGCFFKNNFMNQKFRGVKLVNGQNIKLYIRFANINEIINELNELSNLRIEDACLLVHYVGKAIIHEPKKNGKNNSFGFFNCFPSLSSIFSLDMENQQTSITQYVRTWVNCERYHEQSGASPLTCVKIKIPTPHRKISKIIIHSDAILFGNVAYFSIQCDGQERNRINAQDLKKIYEHNNKNRLDDSIFVLNTHLTSKINDICIIMQLHNACKSVKLICMYDDEIVINSPLEKSVNDKI